MKRIDVITGESIESSQDLTQYKRFIYQIENIVEFSKDDAADQVTLVMMIEQCLCLKTGINYEYVTVN